MRVIGIDLAALVCWYLVAPIEPRKSGRVKRLNPELCQYSRTVALTPQSEKPLYSRSFQGVPECIQMGLVVAVAGDRSGVDRLADLVAARCGDKSPVTVEFKAIRIPVEATVGDDLPGPMLGIGHQVLVRHVEDTEIERFAPVSHQELVAPVMAPEII